MWLWTWAAQGPSRTQKVAQGELTGGSGGGGSGRGSTRAWNSRQGVALSPTPRVLVIVLCSFQNRLGRSSMVPGGTQRSCLPCAYFTEKRLRLEQ